MHVAFMNQQGGCENGIIYVSPQWKDFIIPPFSFQHGNFNACQQRSNPVINTDDTGWGYADIFYAIDEPRH